MGRQHGQRDADADSRAKRARCDFANRRAVFLHRIAFARDGFALHLQRAYAARRFALVKQRFAPGEFGFIQFHSEVAAALKGRPLFAQFVAIERQAGFQSQHVARA